MAQPGPASRPVSRGGKRGDADDDDGKGKGKGGRLSNAAVHFLSTWALLLCTLAVMIITIQWHGNLLSQEAALQLSHHLSLCPMCKLYSTLSLLPCHVKCPWL